ncbi:MAG: T9SS type A sorting domain-containing protein [Ferruginibacter sp.]
MKKKLQFISITFIFMLFQFGASAADYYWRAAAINNVYSNIGNWETTPGGGISPAVAPGVNDNVFFMVASNFSSINLNNGNCKDFNVTASDPAAFDFSGTLTAINGSLNCPNGNASFNFSGTQNFTGADNHFINMGTSAVRITGSNISLDFNNGTSMGTYTLLGPLNTTVGIRLQSQNFNSNGFPISAGSFSIQGSTSKAINLSNSTVIITSITTAANFIQFLSSHNTTDYIFTNTDFIHNNNSSGPVSSIQLNPGVHVSLRSLTLNSSPSSNNLTGFTTAYTGTTPSVLTLDSLILNTANLAIGMNGFDNSYSFGSQSSSQLNINVLHFLRPCTIANDAMVTFNIGAISETSVCTGQSAFIATGYSPVFLNTTMPITTNTLNYAGVSFGGNGITAGASNNLGNNTGAITWGAVAASITYWWVGGNGNWADPSKWSIIGSGGAPQSPAGCLPTIKDDVIFDANSFTGNQTVTINSSNGFCRDLSWLGTNKGLLTSVSPNFSNYSGNLFISGNANFSGARGVAANLFYTGSGTHTITSGTYFTYSSSFIKIMGTGSYTLADNLKGSATLTFFQHTAGTFNSAGKIIDVAGFCSRSMPEIATNLRTLIITNSEINIRSYTQAQGRRSIDLSFLDGLNAAGSHFKLYNALAFFSVICGNSSSAYLTSVSLNNISFLATSGTQDFITASNLNPYTINYNDLAFAANANISLNSNLITHNVNNYNFTSGFTYSFSKSPCTFNVLTGINTILTGCQELIRIQSQVPGTQANINKAAGPFTVNGALITGINSVGATINVSSGADLGNNNNVNITTGMGRKMFWVNNAGNWSDGNGHWSIGVSGGDPAITNTLGCIPRQIDDVIFDSNSFNNTAQTITMNIDGNARSMVWTASAGIFAPVFSGSATRNLNLYDSLELAAGMNSPYLGKITMLGSKTDINENSINMNGVETNGSILLNGNGRYDLLDSVRIISIGNGIELARGNFVTHGKSIYASGLTLAVTGTNAADISNSFIHLFNSGYRATHNASGTWNAAGSIIQTDISAITITNTAPVTYADIIMNSISSAADIIGSSTQPVTFRNITWLQTPNIANGGSLMDGIFTIDTLWYPPSSFNTLAAGAAKAYTIADTLIAYGTPCTPASIRSANAGTAAKLNSSRCNFDLNLVNIRDIDASDCNALQNKVIGTDEGSNSNWTITGITGLSRLGNDTAIVCGGTALIINTRGLGSIPGITYLWSTGQTTDTIEVRTSGTYNVTVTYAPGCFLNDSITVTCAIIVPVTLTDFFAVKQNENSFLTWTTSSENNTARFLIEHATDGQNFRYLGTVTATGNSSSARNYSFIHNHPPKGISYYRLKIVDMDDRYTYSAIKALDFTQSKITVLVYPNPAKNNIIVSGVEAGMKIHIINADGRLVASQQVKTNAENILIKNLAAGFYIIQVIKDAAVVSIVKFTKDQDE